MRRFRSTRIFSAAVCLLLCVAISATLLFSRLVAFAAQDSTHYIPLTQSSGITRVITGSLDAQGNFRPESLRTSGRSPLLASSVDKTFRFALDAGNATWQGVSELEIFKASYDGTVVSGSGDKVIAPGTENSYTFALENTASGNLEYEVTVQAYVTPGEYDIPVVAKLTRNNQKYLYGSADTWAEVEKLNVTDSAVLAEDMVMPYTLTWQWPFEGDDSADTLLGNQDEVTLTVVITTYASYTPEAGEGIPKTGDTSGIGLWFAVMLGSGAGLMFLLLLLPRKKEEADEQR